MTLRQMSQRAVCWWSSPTTHKELLTSGVSNRASSFPVVTNCHPALMVTGDTHSSGRHYLGKIACPLWLQQALFTLFVQ